MLYLKEERKELILGVLDRKFQERDLVIYEGNKIWREYFFNLWNDMKTFQDLHKLLHPHYLVPREEVQLILNLQVEESRNVRLELQNLNRIKRARREEREN